MSTIVNRNGIWQARYTDTNGKQHRTSTHIPVKDGNGLPVREAKKAAEAVAAGLEASVKGAASERVIRSVQMQLETVGIARKVTVREWFKEFQTRPEFLHTKEQTQKSYAQICNDFCKWLGKDADAPITKINSARIVDYLNYESRELGYAAGTVIRHRAALRAENTAPEAHPEAYARFIDHLDQQLKDNTYDFCMALREILEATNDEFAVMSWMEKAAAEGNAVALQFVGLLQLQRGTGRHTQPLP